MSHKRLLKVVQKMLEDYEPWGGTSRDHPTIPSPDCSCGCVYFNELKGQVGADWGVCMNPKSHRAGLLTFEHQGCRKFKLDPKLRDDG